MTESTEQVKDNKKSGVNFGLFGIIAAVFYAIMSNAAMNDLWKYDVDQRYGSFFSSPTRHLDSGMTYVYISLFALALSAALFFLHVKKKGGRNFIIHLIIVVVLIGLGFLFDSNKVSYEPEFTEYIIGNFGPFWAWTLTAPFLACGVAAFLNNKKGTPEAEL